MATNNKSTNRRFRPSMFEGTYVMTVDFDGTYVKKPVDEFVIDLLNEVMLLKEDNARIRKDLRKLKEKEEW